MFRIVKFALYVAVGYLIYEFILGVIEKRPVAAVESSPAPEPEEPGHINMTGPTGDGAEVSVKDAGGGRRKTRVGRGVVPA